MPVPRLLVCCPKPRCGEAAITLLMDPLVHLPLFVRFFFFPFMVLIGVHRLLLLHVYILRNSFLCARARSLASGPSSAPFFCRTNLLRF
jgi:hypothetical protein